MLNNFIASAHTGEPLDEYPDISGITTARVCIDNIYYLLLITVIFLNIFRDIVNLFVFINDVLYRKL